jgi:hypothetical protein
MPRQRGEAAASESSLNRLNVKINPSTASSIRAVCGWKQISLTEAVRQAIGVWRFIEEALRRGASVQIVEPDGSKSQIFIP